MTSYYRIDLVQVSKTSPSDMKGHIFNKEEFYGNTIEEAMEKMRLETGIVKPKRPKKIYRDTVDGESKEVGFITWRWNRDISHMSSFWWEENWIEVKKVSEESVLA